jgi:hypothetical protein
MKIHIRVTVVTVALAVLTIFGCSERNNQPSSKAEVKVPNLPTSFSGLTRYLFETERTPKFEELYAFDYYYFYQKHRHEILKTLILKDSIITKNIGVAFVSYKIDTTSYNDVVWFRNIDGRWWICLSQYFSEYSNDPFGDGLPDGAKEIIKRADNWKKQGGTMWWN